MYGDKIRVCIPTNDWITVGALKFNLYRSIVKAANIPYTKVRSGGRMSLLVDDRVISAINAYTANGGFANMRLDEYLRRTFQRNDFGG